MELIDLTEFLDRRGVAVVTFAVGGLCVADGFARGIGHVRGTGNTATEAICHLAFQVANREHVAA